MITPEPSDEDRAPSTMTVTMFGCTAFTTLARSSPPVTVAAAPVATVPLVVAAGWSARYRPASTPPAVPPPAIRASTAAPPAIRRGQCRPPGAGGIAYGGAGGGGGIVRSCRSSAYV